MFISRGAWIDLQSQCVVSLSRGSSRRRSRPRSRPSQAQWYDGCMPASRQYHPRCMFQQIVGGSRTSVLLQSCYGAQRSKATRGQRRPLLEAGLARPIEEWMEVANQVSRPGPLQLATHQTRVEYPRPMRDRRSRWPGDGTSQYESRLFTDNEKTYERTQDSRYNLAGVCRGKSLLQSASRPPHKMIERCCSTWKTPQEMPLMASPKARTDSEGANTEIKMAHANQTMKKM